MHTSIARAVQKLLTLAVVLSLFAISPGLAAAPEPSLVMDLNPVPGIGSFPKNLTAVGNTLFFVANDGVLGDELWKADPTGAYLVKDIAPGADTLIPYNLNSFNGLLYFTANDGSGAGEELWISDGTITGTVMLKDINPTGNSNPTRFNPANGWLFFQATDGVHGYELWKTDGTPDGTLMVKDINPLSASSSPTILTEVGNTLFFVATDNLHGEELWKSDGTPQGTAMVKDIQTGITESLVRRLIGVGSTLFFRADDGIHGEELWTSDGSETGTALVKDIYPGATSSLIVDLAVFNGEVLFRATDDSSGTELWKSDGTTNGTLLVKDIIPGMGSSQPASLVAVGGKIYFSAISGSIGRELWMSDGSQAGTQLVKDIHSSGSSSTGQYTDANGTVFFHADDLDHGIELWKTNGSEASTQLVKDLLPGVNSSEPGQFTLVQNTLYFAADDGTHGQELWALDLQNMPPTAIAGGPYSGVEGSAVTLSGTTMDDSGPTSAEWTTAVPGCAFSNSNSLQTDLTCSDNSIVTVNLQITDWWNISASDQATVTISNAAPQITTILLSANPSLIGQPLIATVHFNDPGQADTHTANMDWGDGSPLADMTVDQVAGTATASHTYSALGLYTLAVSVVDDDGAAGDISLEVSVVETLPELHLYLPILAR